MDTERLKSKGDKSRGGKNNTQTILTSAGTAAFGGVAGAMAAGFGMNDHDDEKSEEEKNEAKAQDEETQEQNENSQESEDIEEQASTQSSDINETDSTQPHPTDNNGQATSGGMHDPQQPTPEEVAQSLLKNDVDPDDIDLPDAIAVHSFTTVMDEDGNELQAAIVSSPDGGNFLLVDRNDDGNFNVLETPNGIYVAEIETKITHDDLEAMLNTSGGYLALNSQDKPVDVNPDPGDIIDTEHPGEAYLAQQSSEHHEDENERNDSDPIDDLISQLVDGDDDDDDVIVDEDDSSDSYDDIDNDNYEA